MRINMLGANFKSRTALMLVLCLAPWDQALSAELKVLLRYDDFSHASNPVLEQRLFDAARKGGGGVLVGVIPFPGEGYPEGDTGMPMLMPKLPSNKIDLLKQFANNGTIAIAAHGFNHRDNVPTAENSEFAGLPEALQVKLLGMARNSLETAVGTEVISFIPPYNQYDAATLSALEDAGFGLLSAGLHGPAINSSLAFLPGGPYPYRIRQIIDSAIANGHLDAIIVSTIHPYDISESGAELPSFRNNKGQISIQQIENVIAWLQAQPDIRLVSVAELIREKEDLSADRLNANRRLRKSIISRQRLLPKALNLYPLDGLYYPADRANSMYAWQITVATIFYLLIAAAVAFPAHRLLSLIPDRHERRSMQMATGLSMLGLAAVVFKSMFSGFYLSSATILASLLGLVAGMAGHRWLHSS
ncbi:MAG TPA: DUF2334 domain-containing protein [Sedimenticola sp.]|nr:DUF2334 domain-containing protein [Sedimenticola sp.]